MKLQSIVVKPYLEIGASSKAGITVDFRLESEADLRRLLQFLRNPNRVVTFIVACGVREIILRSETIAVADLEASSREHVSLRELLEPL